MSSRRVCIVAVTPEALSELKKHLPEGIAVTGEREVFDRNILEVKLEGDALPMWCATRENAYYMRAGIQMGEDGVWHFFPGAGVTVNMTHQTTRISE